jgi:carboxymethylenebutenolidase
MKLKASDGHELDAYIVRPAGEPLAGLVILQEIYGVNGHIRLVAEGYAKDGFLVVAPAIFDRLERDVELAYEGPDRDRAMDLLKKMNPATTLLDVDAALGFARKESGKKAGVVGFCFGGLLSWLSATRLHPDVAVGYYAGGIGNFAAEEPRAPVQLHFGRLDTHIPAEQVEKVQKAHPQVEIHWYDGAGHAFNRDVSPASYNADAATLARSRALIFLKKYLT